MGRLGLLDERGPGRTAEPPRHRGGPGQGLQDGAGEGRAPRAEVQTADDAKEFLDMGVRHFSIGTDITILYGWWQENGEAIWKTMEDAGAGRVE